MAACIERTLSSTDTATYVFNNYKNTNWLRYFTPLQTFFSILKFPQKLIGDYIRDKLFLPLNKPDETTSWDINTSSLLVEWLMGKKEIPKTFSDFEMLQNFKDHFTITKKNLEILSPDKSKTIVFKTYFIESKNEFFSGKKLTYILVSYFGHKTFENFKEEKTKKPWLAENFQNLSGMLPAVLKNLNDNKISVDSLHLFSLGSVTLDSLKKANMIDILPKNIILNRIFISTDKIGKALYIYPIRVCLNNLAWLSGWTANIEKSILNFFKKVSDEKGKTYLKDRTIINIKAIKDNYFGKPYSFDMDFESKLEKTGLKVFSGEFYAVDEPLRSQHATRLSNFIAFDKPKNETGTNTDHFLKMQEGESLAYTLAKFLSSDDEKDHQVCLNIGGNRENLNLMVKNALPILNEFIKINNK